MTIALVADDSGRADRHGRADSRGRADRHGTPATTVNPATPVSPASVATHVILLTANAQATEQETPCSVTYPPLVVYVTS